jgi:hypothetical protein
VVFREKLCDISKPLMKKQKNEETRVSGPDTYKMNDYMIHLINTNKIRIIKASLVD